MDITRRHHLRALEHAVNHLRRHHLNIVAAAKAALPPLLDTAVPTPSSAGTGG